MGDAREERRVFGVAGLGPESWVALGDWARRGPLKRRREQIRSKREKWRDLKAKGRVMIQVENEMNERAFLKLCGGTRVTSNWVIRDQGRNKFDD
jgi:hypothetical protein